MESFAEEFHRLLREAHVDIEPHAPALGLNGPPPDDTPVVTLRRVAGYMQISNDLLTPVSASLQRASRCTRARWRWQAWRERVGRKVGGWLAGVDLSEREDDW